MRAFQIDDSAANVPVSLTEAPAPSPAAGQILIKVHAAGVIATELLWYPTKHQENGEPRIHAIPGHEFSGAVASLGDGAAGFAPGDEVYGMNDWFWEGASPSSNLEVLVIDNFVGSKGLNKCRAEPDAADGDWTLTRSGPAEDIRQGCGPP